MSRLIPLLCSASLISACSLNTSLHNDADKPLNKRITPAAHHVPQVMQDMAKCNNQDEINRSTMAYLDEWYFWRDQLPKDVNTSNIKSTSALIEHIKAYVPQDKWSTSETFDTYQSSHLGKSSNENGTYGLKIGLDKIKHQINVLDVYSNSPSEKVNILRGDRITAINDMPINKSNEALFQSLMQPGSIGADSQIKLTWLTSSGDKKEAFIQREPIKPNRIRHTNILQVLGKKVGYIAYDMFDQTSSTPFNRLIKTFKHAQINDLIIDLRYNPGGFGHIANQIASQVAGEHVRGKTFLRIQLNNRKHDPNRANIPFILKKGQATLNLPRVYILTTKRSASASELLINALTPHIEVITIGERTNGKPYGMRVARVCDEILFVVTRQNLNSEGNGHYENGISPTCDIKDTPLYSWGDKRDPVLNEALHYIEHTACSRK